MEVLAPDNKSRVPEGRDRPIEDQAPIHGIIGCFQVALCVATTWTSLSAGRWALNMAAEVERNLLNHYGLTNLYPAEWPEREDESDASEDEDKLERNLSRNSRMSKSRFAGLDKQMSIRSRLSGTRESGGGPGNLVQKDEADPLGVAPSVVQELRRRGLAVEDDLKLRNRFMLSSTTFSPTLFLSQVHQTASTDSLLQGLDFLSRSIEKKSASLKVLVESNFERFVRAKATIDNVYMEMRTQGVQQQAAAPPPRKPHSRHTSKGSTHFRNTSGPFSPIASKAPVEDKKKNALTKESEYGVQGIKAPLIELAVKAEEVWGPALGGRDREDELKSVLTYVEQNKSTLQLGGGIRDSIRKRDYETLVQDYNHASRLSEQARSIAEDTIHQDRDLTDGQIHQIIVTAKMWHDVQTQLNAFKVDAMRQLASAQSDSPLAGQEEKRETHMEVIAVLLQIGIDENPFWFWLSSWYDRLKNKILRTFERARLEIEVLRRRLANSDKPAMAVVKAHLQSAAVGAGKDRGQHLDSAKVIQFWELVESALRNLLSARGGLLGEIVEFWDTARSLIESKAQKRLPAAVWNTEASKRHLEMSQEHVEQLYNGVAELIQLTRESVFALFTDPPIEDISDLFSPLPQTPGTPQSAFPANDRPARFNFDPADLPLPSPQKGEAWEKYAFWPPNANALSGVHYLSRILILVGTAASEATAISAIKQDTRMTEQLRGLVGGVRERCVQAVCAAWNSDAEKCKVLEDWTRSADRRDLTNMPASFMAFEETILTNMQKILYISEAMTRTDSADVVVPPSAKLLQMVRSQFVTSLYKALSGTVENAERTNTGDVANDDDLDLRAGFYNINASANAVEGTDRVSPSDAQQEPQLANTDRTSACF